MRLLVTHLGSLGNVVNSYKYSRDAIKWLYQAILDITDTIFIFVYFFLLSFGLDRLYTVYGLDYYVSQTDQCCFVVAQKHDTNAKKSLRFQTSSPLSVLQRETVIYMSTDKTTKQTNNHRGMENIQIDKNATNAVESYLEYRRWVCFRKSVS